MIKNAGAFRICNMHLLLIYLIKRHISLINLHLYKQCLDLQEIMTVVSTLTKIWSGKPEV